MSEEANAEAVEPTEQDAAPPEVDTRAREMGWRPLEEFKGDPEKWVDAETFVKRGEEVLPIVRANAKRMVKELSEARSEIAGLRKTFKEFAEHHTQTEKRAYDRAMKDIQSRLDEAAANGDVQGVRDATDELVSLNKDAKPAAAEPKPADITAARKAFETANPWYKDNRELRAIAKDIGDDLAEEGGFLDPTEFFAEVGKRIRAEFPEKFENPARKAAATVEGGGTAPRKGGKTRSDLPADARATMDRWVKQGLLTEAQYIRDYFQ